MTSLIDTIDFDLINTIVNCAEIFIVRCRSYAVYMWTEVTLSDTSKSFMEHAVHNTSKTSIFMRMYNSHLTIMISCYIQISAVYVCGKKTASHSVNSHTVDTGEVSMLVTLEYRNTLILYGIQELTVFGNCCV